VGTENDIKVDVGKKIQAFKEKKTLEIGTTN